MRVVRGIAERAVDLRLQLFGDDVLEPLGFVVNGVDVQAQRLRQVQLQQPVVADDLQRDLLAGAGQRHATIRLVCGETERSELLHHRACGRRRDALCLCERRYGDRAIRRELVDLAQVVLDRVGQSGLRHRCTV